MNSPEQLFELIKSLSPAEKRHFKLEASKYQPENTPDYLLLYGWIEQQEQYDEERLKKTFKGQTWLTRLPSVKNYLYNQLLKSLTIFHAENKSGYQASWLLQQVDILFARGLYKHARKLLSKAKKLAEEYQLQQSQLIIHQWEYAFAELIKQPTKSEEELQRIHAEEQATLDDLVLRISMERLHEKAVRYMYQKGTARTPEEQEAYRTFIDNPLLEQAKSSPSAYIRDLRASILGVCYYMMMDKDTSFVYSEERLQIMEAVPHILLENNRDYFVGVFNIIQILLSQNKLKEAVAVLEKADALIKNPKVHISKRTAEFVFLLQYCHTPRILMAQGKFAEIVAMNKETEREFLKWEEEEHRNRVTFMVPMVMSAANFITGNNDKALVWLHFILNDTSNTVRYDVLGSARIVHLLVQYELGNYGILEHYIDATQRYIKEHQNMHKFEQLCLRFIRQLSQTVKGDKKYNTILQKMQTEWEAFTKVESFEKQVISNYCLLEWAESKLQRRPFLEIVLERKSV